jgi:hypothetical protein
VATTLSATVASSERKRVMKASTNTKLSALGILAAVAVVSIASASPATTRQRFAIEARGSNYSHSGTFVFRSVTRGALGPDVGRYSYTVESRRPVIRNGYPVDINIVLTSFTGRRGTFEIRARNGLLGAGNGYSIGTGTWSFVRGTRAYAGLTGRGRIAFVITPRGPESARVEGVLSRQ